MRTFRLDRPLVRILTTIGIGATAWVFAGPLLLEAVSPPSGRVTGFFEDFNGGTVNGDMDVAGFYPGVDGWYLGPRQQGILTYRLPHNGRGRVRLTVAVWFYTPGASFTRLEVSGDGGRHFDALSVRRTLVGGRLTSTVFLVPGEPLVFRFSAANATDQERLFVDQFTGNDVPGSTLELGSAVFLLSAMLLPWTRRHSVPWVLALLLAVSWGSGIRLQEAALFAEETLEPDAIGYRHMATVMDLFTPNGFYAGNWGQREPLFMFVVKLWFGIAGTEPVKLRVLTAILSSLVIGFSAWAAWRIFGPTAAIFVGVAIAASQPLIREAGRGLRLELEMLLLMCYVLLFTTLSKHGPLRQAWVLGAFTGTMGLLRTTYLPALSIVNIWILYRGRSSRTSWFWPAVLTLCVAAVLTAPHRYSLYRHYGDPFHDTALYARWNANFEFAGQPGYPTIEELQRDAYVGPHISYATYLFGLHTPWQLAAGTVSGMKKLFKAMDIRVDKHEWINHTIQGLGLAGFLLAIFDRRFAWLPLLFVLLEVQGAYLYDRRLLETYRHTIAGLPLVLFAACYFVQRVLTARRLGRLSSSW